MNSIQAEITQRVLELMAYIHSVTGSESEYESLLSQAAMELLDEAVLFEDSNMDSDTTGDLFNPHSYTDDDDLDDEELDDLDDILSWDDWDYDDDDLDSVEDDDDDDTEYRQQADGRVL